MNCCVISVVLGGKRPAWVTTSISSPQVRVCVTSPSARAMVSRVSSLAVKGAFVTALLRRVISARLNAGWFVVALTMFIAAAFAAGLAIGEGLGEGPIFSSV